MDKNIKLKKENGVAVVTLDNAPMNVLSLTIAKELEDVIQQIAVDPEVIVVIITGAGERAFSAGADIKQIPEWFKMSEEELGNNVRKFHRMLSLIDNPPKPTIACLNGITFGGGCELALACYIRIAEEHVKISLPEIKLGLFPDWGGTQRLPRLIGEAKAKELMFMGNTITAETAERIGLVNQVVAKGEGLNMTTTMAQTMTGYSLQPLSRIKKAVNEGMEKSFDEAIDLEVELFTEIFFRTEDVKEGVQAFIEKRKPEFKHR
ncbi:enoyl-CoA hydratase [Alkalihalophilus pseudofirmus]|nr:enoyl-CoA hydratase [Alkalihalophilus pseudofirmus]